jgi:alpha-L-rhamnosidase
LKKLTLTFVIILSFVLIVKAGIHSEKLTCENLENPSVVDVKHPRLGWINIADKGDRGQKQTACQIRVASSKARLEEADLWRGTKITSDNSTRVEYSGSPLQSRQDCRWQVRVWDKNGDVSEWSEPAFWRRGLLDASDWQATWIGAPWQGEETLPKPGRGSRDNSLEETPPPSSLLNHLSFRA